MSILERLDQQVERKVKVKPAAHAGHPALA
jgi:hypothetical protein